MYEYTVPMSKDNQNVSPDEIHKFNEFAKDWWDPQGSMKPLHILNPLRLGYVETHTSLSGKQVADIGCGVGLLSEALAKAGATVTALDLSPGAIEAAKAHAITSHLKIDYQVCAAETLAETSPEKFDVITCMEMLEHVPDPSAVIDACTQLVKPGGKIFFSTINRTPQSFLTAIVGAEYVLGLLPRGTHHYKKLIRPSELDQWSRSAGLKLIDLSGVQYNPFTERCHLNQHVQVNYICCYEKPNH